MLYKTILLLFVANSLFADKCNQIIENFNNSIELVQVKNESLNCHELKNSINILKSLDQEKCPLPSNYDQINLAINTTYINYCLPSLRDKINSNKK